MDVYAVLTSLGLLSMFLLRRRRLAKVWRIYVAYLCFVLPLQYVLAVGIPPGLCVGEEGIQPPSFFRYRHVGPCIASSPIA